MGITLQWRHNEHDCISNHRHLNCLTQPFVQARIRANIKALRHWPLWGEFTGHRSHRGPVMWRTFPFDDVIIILCDAIENGFWDVRNQIEKQKYFLLWYISSVHNFTWFTFDCVSHVAIKRIQRVHYFCIEHCVTSALNIVKQRSN